MSQIAKNTMACLNKRLPRAHVWVDEPLAPSGTWHFDVAQGKHSVALQWSPQKGFGVSADPDPGLGEGPHEVYVEIAQAIDRVAELLKTGESTHAPQEAMLAALRDLLGISQEELAGRLKMRQASVSKLERQSDMKISTLGKLMGAMGVGLEIFARVGEAPVKLTQFGGGKHPAGKASSRRKRRRA